MRSLGFLLAGCGSLLLSLSTSASAATVRVRPDPADDRYEQVHVVAAPGESNRIRLQVEMTEDAGVAFFTWKINDASSPLTPGAGCVAVDPHTAECKAQSSKILDPALGRIRLELGDRDDELGIPAGPEGERLPDARVSADGGDGDDRLHGFADSKGRLHGGDGDDFIVAPETGDHKLDGGPGDDLLQGGSGHDVLRGGGGRDRLFGAGADDHLIDGDLDGATGDAGPGPDLLDGGSGSSDRVSYKLRTRGVDVDLDRRRANGRTGEGDLLSGFEAVTGGRGDDRLAGTHGPDTIRGRRGSDLLIGRGSADILEPGRGSDVVACGAGADRVSDDLKSFDLLEPSCEAVEAYVGDDSFLYLNPYPTSVRSDRMTFRLTCPWYEPGDETVECSGAFRLREAFGRRRLLAVGTFPLGSWSGRPVTVRFTRIGRLITARPRGVVTVVSLTGRSLDSVGWRIRLRMPP